MHNLNTSYKTSDERIYYSTTMDASHKLMQPLINAITDYNPLFRETHKKLCDNVANLVKNDKLAIQQFTDSLTSMNIKITSIQGLSENTKNGLIDIRNDLSQSIRNVESKLSELEVQKAGLQGKKEILDNELKQKQNEYEALESIPFIGSKISKLLKVMRHFHASLLETSMQLSSVREEIQSLRIEKSYAQQVLQEATNTFNTSQSLFTHCINILNNINNLQNTLKEFEDLDSDFFEIQLAVLENNWNGLMKITNA